MYVHVHVCTSLCMYFMYVYMYRVEILNNPNDTSVKTTVPACVHELLYATVSSVLSVA